MRLPMFVCLSVCEQDYSKTRAWIWMKYCMSADVGTRTKWLTFEPDPDYSLDTRTGLLSPISYALQRGILLHRENPTYAYWRGWSLQRGVVLKWFYSLWAMGTPLSEVRALYQVPCCLIWIITNVAIHLVGKIPSWRRHLRELLRRVTTFLLAKKLPRSSPDRQTGVHYYHYYLVFFILFISCDYFSL